MKLSHRPPRKGFSLVEIMIVIVIAGLLAMLAVPAYQKLRRSSAGKAMVVDARNIGEAMRRIAAEYPKAATAGSTFSITVAPDGTLSSASLGSDAGAIPAGKITELVPKVSRGTGSPITYAFGAPAGGVAFTLTHPHCAPSDVAPSSMINLSAVPGTPVQFDEDGNAL